MQSISLAEVQFKVSANGISLVLPSLHPRIIAPSLVPERVRPVRNVEV